MTILIYLTLAVTFSRSQCRAVAFLWPGYRFKEMTLAGKSKEDKQ
jgi:hypothetical protein